MKMTVKDQLVVIRSSLKTPDLRWALRKLDRMQVPELLARPG